MTNLEAKIPDLLKVVAEADQAVMTVYNSDDFGTEEKADQTPITKADIAAHRILMDGITRLFPDIPVISEEGQPELHLEDLSADQFWLMDPLDGTREFINRSRDFTICLGLLEDAAPTFGIVSAPARGVVYYGGRQLEASFKKNRDEEARRINVRRNSPGIVIASRMFLNTETEAFILENYPNYEVTNVGSQLKLPLIAEGLADVCPRLNTPQHLWDLAAGHAILEGAGGKVTKLDGSPINYRAEDLRTGDFIAHN